MGEGVSAPSPILASGKTFLEKIAQHATVYSGGRFNFLKKNWGMLWYSIYWASVKSQSKHGF